MKYYKVEYINSEGKVCSDTHCPETMRFVDNSAITIKSVNTCDCKICLHDAFEILQKIRELVR